MARLAITSLAFMFVWVPLPVCHTTSGKWSSRRPAITSSAAWTMARALSSGRSPSSRFTSAAGLLEDAERPDHLAGKPLAADPEVLEGSLRSGRPSSGRRAPRRRPSCRVSVRVGPGTRRAGVVGSIGAPPGISLPWPALRPSDGQAAAALAAVGVRVQDNVQARDPPGSEGALERGAELARLARSCSPLPPSASTIRSKRVNGSDVATARSRAEEELLDRPDLPPPAVVADDADDGQVEAHRGLDLHAVEPEGAVARDRSRRATRDGAAFAAIAKGGPTPRRRTAPDRATGRAARAARSSRRSPPRRRRPPPGRCARSRPPRSRPPAGSG